MTTSKYNASVFNLNSIRTCDISIVPLNQLEKIGTTGCYIPVIKRGVSSEAPQLTEREGECLSHLAEGHGVKKIAAIMALSERRIFNILEALRDKFSVSTDHGIVSKYYQMGLDASL